MEQVLKAIYNVLSNDANVTGITTNIFPIVAPEQTNFPCVVYYVTGVMPHDTKSGPSTVDHMFVTIDCYAEDTEAASGYQTASNLGEYIRTALDRLTPATYATIDIDGVQFIDADSGFDKQSDVYVVSMDFKVRVNR